MVLWYGIVRYRTVRYGMVWYGMVCMVLQRPVKVHRRPWASGWPLSVGSPAVLTCVLCHLPLAHPVRHHAAPTWRRNERAAGF